MITPSHMIYGWALAKATKRVPDKKRTLAFVAGGLIPDLPTYVFFIIQTFIAGATQRDIWNILYFDSAWTPFITLSHSLLLWPLLLAIATFTKQRLLQFVSLSAVMHVVFDFFVHNDDAYRHFWPLSDWKFESPISYWDPAHYGLIVGAIDSVIILALLAWLAHQYTDRKIQWVIGSVVLMYVAITILPVIWF